jgi:hypothetical protein
MWSFLASTASSSLLFSKETYATPLGLVVKGTTGMYRSVILPNCEK